MCRQRSGARERSKTVTISVNCYDARTVKLIFLLEQAREPRHKPPDTPPLALELIDPSAGATSQKDKPLSQRFRNFASSPKIGRRMLKSVSEKLLPRGAGTLTTDLAQAKSTVNDTVSMLHN